MTQRWKKTAKTQQLGLALPGRGGFTPATRDTTDTSSQAASSLGLKRGGDRDAMSVENVGDLANAMVGALQRKAARTRTRTRLAGVMLAITLRKEVLDWIEEHPEGATADEIASAIKRSPFTIRPRVSELNKRRLIVDTGLRRPNATSGKSATVWRKA